MIGGSLLPNWGTVFSILFTAGIATCYHVLSLRPSEKRKAIKTKKPLTLRIEGIHINKSMDDLQRELTSIIEGDPDLNQDAITVKTHAIVPRDQRIACATATFYTSIPKDEMTRRLRNASASPKASASPLYRFDDDFQGVTPLYDAGGDADVE